LFPPYTTRAPAPDAMKSDSKMAPAKK